MVKAPVTAPPPTRHGQISDMQVIINCVDQRGRELDQHWGIGRLPMLPPIEWAERFHAQHKLFNAAVWEFDLALVRQHGNAMLRAYDLLDQLAREAKGEPLPVDQWEFETPNGLVILVRDLRDTGRVQRHGRAAQVWALDEIANVIRCHPNLAAAKDAFPGAQVVSVPPSRTMLEQLDDELADIPF
jgi:hypothetical protein